MINPLPHEKGFHVSWDQIHRDARALAWRLDKRGPGKAAHGARSWRSPAAAWRPR
jgi:xanthine phosphoribosyltransferase